MTTLVLPIYILLAVKVLGMILLAFYFQHIIGKKVIGKLAVNIIMIFLVARTVFGFYIIYKNLGNSYNFLILVDHILSMIDAIVLMIIGIFLRK